MDESTTHFFSSPEEFESFLTDNHETLPELWVGYYKKHTNTASITWPESVKVALCFGWIDGLRKSIDEKRYKIRFTPRRKNSHWSKVNIAHIEALKKAGKMRAAGLKAFQARKEKRSGVYSFEQEKLKVLDKNMVARFKENTSAWNNFNHMAPYYKKIAVYWVMSAKQEATQNRRLEILIQSSEQNEKIPQMR